MPLESLCLSVKAALPSAHRLQHALGRLISPPAPDAIASAVSALTTLGALDDDEALTALGRHLTLMPMDARLAKTLIYAVMLRSAPLFYVCSGTAVCCSENNSLQWPWSSIGILSWPCVSQLSSVIFSCSEQASSFSTSVAALSNWPNLLASLNGFPADRHLRETAQSEGRCKV